MFLRRVPTRQKIDIDKYAHNYVMLQQCLPTFELTLFSYLYAVFFFFFWWGLLHGPQQGPDRMKEKKPMRLEKGKLLPKQKNPPRKTTI